MSNKMLPEYTQDYLLDKKVKICQPVEGYRASSDAVLLAAFVAAAKNNEILDVGSGTGAISLCLAQRYAAENLVITGLEKQKDLAELSEYSAKLNGFERVKFYAADIFSVLPPEIKPCSYDVVVSNPPYSEHDMPSPKIGKATAHNYSDYGLEQWLKFCLKMAKPFGRIYMVNRVEALPQICQMFVGGLTVLPIYSKTGQKAKRIIVAAQKDSKAPCRILPPFFVHDESGNYTEAAQKILRQGRSLQEIICEGK